MKEFNQNISVKSDNKNVVLLLKKQNKKTKNKKQNKTKNK